MNVLDYDKIQRIFNSLEEREVFEQVNLRLDYLESAASQPECRQWTEYDIAVVERLYDLYFGSMSGEPKAKRSRSVSEA